MTSSILVERTLERALACPVLPWGDEKGPGKVQTRLCFYIWPNTFAPAQSTLSTGFTYPTSGSTVVLPGLQ